MLRDVLDLSALNGGQPAPPAALPYLADAELDGRAERVRDIVTTAQPVGHKGPEDDDNQAEHQAPEQAATHIEQQVFGFVLWQQRSRVEYQAALDHIRGLYPRGCLLARDVDLEHAQRVVRPIPLGRQT